MKKGIIWVCFLIVGFSFILTLPALALDGVQQQKKGMMGIHCISRWEMFKFMKNLNITEEQNDALKALKDDTDNNTQALETQIVDLQDQMTTSFLAAAIDNATVESQIDAMLVLQNQMSDIILHAELNAVRILTAEQRALILDMVNKLRDCAEAHHGWMGLQKPAYFSLLIPEKAI